MAENYREQPQFQAGYGNGNYYATNNPYGMQYAAMSNTNQHFAGVQPQYGYNWSQAYPNSPALSQTIPTQIPPPFPPTINQPPTTNTPLPPPSHPPTINQPPTTNIPPPPSPFSSTNTQPSTTNTPSLPPSQPPAMNTPPPPSQYSNTQSPTMNPPFQPPTMNTPPPPSQYSNVQPPTMNTQNLPFASTNTQFTTMNTPPPPSQYSNTQFTTMNTPPPPSQYSTVQSTTTTAQNLPFSSINTQSTTMNNSSPTYSSTNTKIPRESQEEIDTIEKKVKETIRTLNACDVFATEKVYTLQLFFNTITENANLSETTKEAINDVVDCFDDIMDSINHEDNEIEQLREDNRKLKIKVDTTKEQNKDLREYNDALKKEKEELEEREDKLKEEIDRYIQENKLSRTPCKSCHDPIIPTGYCCRCYHNCSNRMEWYCSDCHIFNLPRDKVCTECNFTRNPNVANKNLMNDQESYKNQLQCNICADEDCDAVLIPCGHLVHKKCLEGNDSCPYCDQKYKKIVDIILPN